VVQNQQDPQDLLIKIVNVLDDLKIPYLITGGIAVLVWGRPRFTADIDVVIEIQHLINQDYAEGKQREF